MSGCRSAYPDKESAKAALKPLSSASFAPLIALDDGQELTSFDPSEEMAKAYMKQKSLDQEGEEEGSKGGGDGEKKKEDSRQEAGPLAFLGLQQKAKPSPENNEDERYVRKLRHFAI